MSDIPEWNLIAAAIFGLFVLYFVLRMFYKPLNCVHHSVAYDHGRSYNYFI